MASAKGVTTSIQTHVFGKAGHSTLSDPTVWGDVVGAGKLVPALGANAVALEGQDNYIKGVVDIGDLGDSANIVRFSPFGQPTEKTVTGIGGLPEWTFGVVLEEDDTAHAAIRSAKTGDDWEFGVLTVTKFTSGSEEATLDYVVGQISSKPKSFSTSDPSMVNVTVALGVVPTVYHEA